MRIALVAVLAALLLSGSAGAAQTGFAPFVTGLSSPVYVTSAPGDPSTLYVVEQSGRIAIVRNGKVAGTFLDITSLVKSVPFQMRRSAS